MQIQVPAQEIKQIDSLMPYSQVSPCNMIEKKHWHIIATAEIMVPQLTFSLKITQVLLMFDFKIYISIQIMVIPMVGQSQLQLKQEQLKGIEGYHPIQYIPPQAAIGSGIFELPVCARCFLGYSCNKHCKH